LNRIHTKNYNDNKIIIRIEEILIFGTAEFLLQGIIF